MLHLFLTFVHICFYICIFRGIGQKKGEEEVLKFTWPILHESYNFICLAGLGPETTPCKAQYQYFIGPK